MKKYDYKVEEYESDDDPRAFLSVDFEGSLRAAGEEGYRLISVNAIGKRIYFFLEKEEKE
jgi:hypothetical protein